MKEIMSVAVGQVFLCIEGRPSSHHVEIRVRERKENGRPGRTIGLEVERRSGLFAIAMGMLSVGGSLPPEQAFDQNETVGTARNTPHRIPLRQQEWDLLDGMRSVDAGEPQRSIQAVKAMHRKLQRRMHIVQRCVQLMEVLGDQDAQQIDLLLTLAATGRPLPFSIHVGPASTSDQDESRRGLPH
ncbi:hypothetical protein RAS12_24235 [Achromobacter seleniivolatilans]|uniref:Uncharacterized protein n=1 Tax=Achromobacter seleniivolatilans TaxID=3047478 RepID=A0ABY9M1E8_9BURK|nr:hypothetical protein [Achromobacter sp. R39]WMD19697.1 hypothetical protein RAS12_24235 [Achromobacter sp. R39]